MFYLNERNSHYLVSLLESVEQRLQSSKVSDKFEDPQNPHDPHLVHLSKEKSCRKFVTSRDSREAHSTFLH